MTNIVFLTLYLGSMVVTSYRSVPNQTDDSPFHTSTGEHVCKHGVAVSQDLLEKNGGPLNYGDWIYIEGIGVKQVNDCMNKRYKKQLDIWVVSYEDEKRFHNKFKNKKLSVSKLLIGVQHVHRQVVQ